MGQLKLWGLILAFPAIVVTATLYCSSQNFPGCEKKEHKAREAQQEKKEPEVALSPILLADKEQPKPAESDKRSSEPSQQCPTACGIVAKTFDDPVGFFTAVLCYMVLLQLIWMTRQEGVLRESVAVAKKAADAAKDSAESVKTHERAYLFAFPSQWMRQEDSTYITMNALNYGKTPGMLEKLSWDIRPFSDEPWVMPEDFSQTLVVRKIIRPNNDAIPIELTALNVKDTAPLAFYGRAYFYDVFGDEWSAIWAYRIEPSQGWAMYSLEHHARLRREDKSA